MDQPPGNKAIRIAVSAILAIVTALLLAYALTHSSEDRSFQNPVAYLVKGDTIYVVEKEGNQVLALQYKSLEETLVLKDKTPIEADDSNYYYMIRRLYDAPDGVVVRSWIYDRQAKKFSGYRFRLYPSFDQAPRTLLTIYLKDDKKFPDIHYAADGHGNHYFVNNLDGQLNLWRIPAQENVTITGENLPQSIRQMGEKNNVNASWNAVYVDGRGRIYVSSVETDRIVEYSPEGARIRQIGSVGFQEGLLLAPMEVYSAPLEWNGPSRITIASTGNRSWVQFNDEGKAVHSVSPLQAGYPFPDILVGQTYPLPSAQSICSFDLVNKSFLIHGNKFRALTNYKSRQTENTLLLAGLALLFLLPVIFYGHFLRAFRKFRFPLLFKLLVITIPPIIVCAYVVGYYVTDVFKDDLENEAVLRSANLAQAVLNSISIRDLEAIRRPEDRGSPAYERIYKTVNRIVDRKVDHTPKWIIHKIRERRYYYGINAWRGSIYEPFIVPRDRTMFIKALNEGTPQHGRFRDEQGEWFSYLAPIRDPDGKVIYVLELFRPTEALDRSEKEAQYWIKRIGGTTIAAAIILIFLFAFLSTRPLKRLIQGTQIIKDGSFDYRIRISSRDEMETLGEAFNVMVADLKKHTDALTQAVKVRESIENKLAMADAIQQSMKQVIGGILAGKKSDYSFEWLIPHMSSEHHRKGDYLIRKGDRADKMYYIQEGALRLEEMNILIGKGNLIGETGILSPAKERTVSVLCEEDCELYSLDEARAKVLFYEDPSIIFQLIHLSIERSLQNITAAVAEKERIEEDLKIANEIQTSVLPRTFPAFPDRTDFDIFASMEPAKEVGGDFYDFFLINDKKLCFIIGDVSGKGVPAALFMMITKIMLQTVAFRNIPANEILFHVNNIIAAQNEHGMFVTILCALLDTETGELEIGNAGHNPPLICRSDGDGFEFVQLPESLVLGPMEDIPFSSMRMTLQPGDIIFFYTDGVTEALNHQLELYSEKRLQGTLTGLKELPIADMAKNVSQALKDHAQGAPQSDDITMVILKYQGPEKKAH